ncbi:MAG: hypothetical protein GY805_02470 [Chloroflexi bacterium]|nr:hypothetical protein [Chloroflexota bacterium]
MTWPVVTNLKSQLIGGGVDQWTHLWTYNWIKDQFFLNPFSTNIIFYPTGVSLATHNIAWFNILLWIPLQAVFGKITAYNLVFLFILTLNGLGLFFLAKELTGSIFASFVGGLIFAVWPYTLSHHDHPNMIFVAWLPLALLFLKRALENRRRRDVWLAALFIILTGLARLHLLIMGSILVALYALYLLARNYTKENIQRLLLIGLVSGFFVVLTASPIILGQISSNNPEDIFLDEQNTHQTDLLAYVLPGFHRPLWREGTVGGWVQLYPAGGDSVLKTPFLGYSVLLLAMSGLILRWRRNWFWGATAVLYILLALGPILRVNNQLYPDIPMLYRLFEDIYFIRILRQPNRFNIILGISIAILAAQGVQIWLKKFKQPHKILVVTLIISGVILLDYLPVPYPQTNYTTPSWFIELANDPDEFAILNIPFDLFGYNKRHMFDQVIHGKPIVNGKVSRVPREALAFLDSTPFLHAISQDRLLTTEPSVSAQLRPLADANIRYLVLHKDLLSAEELLSWQQWISIRPRYEDEFLIVYSTEPQKGRDFDLIQPLTAELSLFSVSMPKAAVQGNWLAIETIWGSGQSIDEDLTACLEFMHQTSGEIEAFCQPFSQSWPTSRWQSNEIVHSSYQIQIDPFFDPGEYQISLNLFNKEQLITQQPRFLGNLSIASLDHQINSTTPQATTAVTWNEELTLSRYDLQITHDQLVVTFHWYAQQRVEKSYKIFLHLLDENGNLVAQLDYIPREWTYPTNWWEEGEFVVDTAVLPLGNIGSGTFQLQVGIYDPDSGERLLATMNDSSALMDAVLLTGISH